MDKTDIKYCKCGEKMSSGEDKCHYCDIIDRVYNQLEELVGQDIPCLGWSPKDLRYTLFLANGEKLELSLCWSGDADEPRD